MNFIYLWDHLVILLRFYFVDAVFLFLAIGLLRFLFPKLKSAGHINALYRLFLFTETAVFLFLIAGLICMIVPVPLFEGLSERFPLVHYHGQILLYVLHMTPLFFVGLGIWIWGFWHKYVDYQNQYHYSKKLRYISSPVGDVEILDRYHGLADFLGMKKRPDLFANPGYTGCYLEGLRRPIVVIPVNLFNVGEQKIAMCHELIHYKRHHLIFRRLSTLVCSLFWFLPVKYLQENVIMLQEVLCDIEVCKVLGTEINPETYFLVISDVMLKKRPIHDPVKEILGEQQDSASNTMITYLMENTIQLIDRMLYMYDQRDGIRRPFLLRTAAIVMAFWCVCIGTLDYYAPDLMAWHAPQLTEAVDVGPETQVVSADVNLPMHALTSGENTETLYLGDAAIQPELTRLMGKTPDKLLHVSGEQHLTLEQDACYAFEPLVAEEGKYIVLDVFSENDGYQVHVCTEARELVFRGGESFQTYSFILEEENTCQIFIENPSRTPIDMEVYLIQDSEQ